MEPTGLLKTGLQPDTVSKPTTNPGGGIGATSQTTPTPTSEKGPVLDKVTSNETVAGQLQGLLSSGNPLVQQAKTNTKQFANQRGLLNSQMAASAGEQAAFNAMMPVAQQDAQANFSQSVLNQNTSNTDYMTTKSQDFQKEMTTKSQDFQKDMTTMSQNFQKEMTQVGYDNRMQEMLLAHMGSAITANNSFLTSMAQSPDVTSQEYDAVQQSLINSMETWTNLWKVSADSDNVFDFSGAI